MALIGPNEYSFKIDSYNATANTVGSAVDLDEITEFSGIVETAQTVDVTALGDKVRREAATGQRSFDRITMGGFVDVSSGTIDSDSAFARIGRPARRSDVPKRTLTVQHKGTTLTQSLEVVVLKNEIIPQTDGPAMWRAEFANVGSTDAEVGEVGF